MPGKAAKVVITERQQEILQRWARSRSCPRGLAQRAEIILLAFDRLPNGPVAEQLGCERHAVGIWRRRWAAAFDTVVRVECLEGLSALGAAVEDVLSDNPAPGARARSPPTRSPGSSPWPVSRRRIRFARRRTGQRPSRPRRWWHARSSRPSPPATSDAF